MKRTFFLLIAGCALFAFCGWISDQTQPASYPGGQDALEQYFRDSLHYPEAEKNASKEDLVCVTFDVSETGVAQNPEVKSLTESSPGFEQEAIRLINAMPAWEPARDKKGRAYASKERVFVRFDLPDSLVNVGIPSEDTMVIVDFTGLDSVAHYRGGDEAFYTYLRTMIRYPQAEKEQNKDGTVYISFVIRQNGKVARVRVEKAVAGARGLEAEAKRVVEAMPRWVPTIVDGRTRNSRMTVPIKFTLH